MIDIYAPIVPGKGAGNIFLGEDTARVLNENPNMFRNQRWGILGNVLYISEDISFIDEDGKIDQIRVHNHYMGKIQNAIGIRDTWRQAETLLGEVISIEDDFHISNMPGIIIVVNDASLYLDAIITIIAIYDVKEDLPLPEEIT